MPSGRWTQTLVALAVTMAVPGAIAGAAPKVDVVHLLNGDRLTCEIVRLHAGRLTLKTDAARTVSVEWDDLAAVTSPATFQVEVRSGARVLGTLAQGAPGFLVVGGGSSPVAVPWSDVVRLDRIGRGLWSRLDGTVDVGFSFTEANVQTQWTLNGSVEYRTTTHRGQLTYDSLLTVREDADRQTRNTLTVQGERRLASRFAAIAIAQLQQNEELDLAARWVGGGGLGWRVVQSPQASLVVVGGGAYTSESYAGADDRATGEAVAGVGYEFHKYDGRTVDVDTSLVTFYALGGDARARVEMTSQVRIDLVGAVYWALNAAESFTSRPPAGRQRSDFVLSASLGWAF